MIPVRAQPDFFIGGLSFCQLDISNSFQDSEKYNFYIEPWQVVTKAKMRSPQERHMVVRIAGENKQRLAWPSTF